MYKVQKDQVNAFGLRTQYGGGKTTGFGLIYDDNKAMKKFEPHYRLVRVGMEKKKEKASRQQRKLWFFFVWGGCSGGGRGMMEAMACGLDAGCCRVHVWG